MNENSTRDRFSGIQIRKWICLLVTVGILCISQKMEAYAGSLADTGLNGNTGTTLTNASGTGAASSGGASTSTGGTHASTGIGEVASGIGDDPNFNISISNGNGSMNGSLRILLILTLIALAPTMLIMLTSFTRIIIVLHFTRAALNTQTAPPNQVLMGLALFLTLFIMSPTITKVYNEAVVPFEAGEITQDEAFKAAGKPIRQFMYTQTQTTDVRMFMEISETEWNGENLDDIPFSVLVPSFIVGELRQAFQIGFLIYIPFIVIDMVVASTLMSMGMMMLPPTTISMPFKILLFILADGWELIIMGVVRTFY